MQYSALHADCFYFEGSDRKHFVGGSTLVRAAPFSSEIYREDGGATSRGAIGER